MINARTWVRLASGCGRIRDFLSAQLGADAYLLFRRWPSALLSGGYARRSAVAEATQRFALQPGHSWGFDRGGVWVDRGCRADFTIDQYQYRGPAPGSVGTVSCSSDDGKRHYCNLDSSGRVRLQRQRSESPCTEGYSWGSDGRVIWVDHGCRADFSVEGGRSGWNRDPDRESRPGSGSGYQWDRNDYQGGQDQVISCSSDDMHRHYCPADTRGGVQLLKQRSDASCRQGTVGVTIAAVFGWTMAAALISRSFGKFAGTQKAGRPSGRPFAIGSK